MKTTTNGGDNRLAARPKPSKERDAFCGSAKLFRRMQDLAEFMASVDLLIEQAEAEPGLFRDGGAAFREAWPVAADALREATVEYFATGE